MLSLSLLIFIEVVGCSACFFLIEYFCFFWILQWCAVFAAGIHEIGVELCVRRDLCALLGTSFVVQFAVAVVLVVVVLIVLMLLML